jgi:hypothetical protein
VPVLSVPDDYTVSFAVDLSHHGHLGGFLRSQSLVDADGVDPELAKLEMTPQSPDRRECVFGYEEEPVIANDGSGRCLTTPYKRVLHIVAAHQLKLDSARSWLKRRLSISIAVLFG